MTITEESQWEATTDLLGQFSITFSKHWSHHFRNDPKKFAFALSRYKFAAKMACKNRTVLELGCGEGIGAPILREQALHYTGIDSDKEVIALAQETFSPEHFTFLSDNFIGKTIGAFQTVVSFDIPDSASYETIFQNLTADGIAVIGTANMTDSPASQLEYYFHTVLSFSMTNELIHIGIDATSSYGLYVCFDKRESL